MFLATIISIQLLSVPSLWVTSPCGPNCVCTTLNWCISGILETDSNFTHVDTPLCMGSVGDDFGRMWYITVFGDR